MNISFIGTLNGVDFYNKIKIIVDEPSIILTKINDVKNPYKFIDNNLECYLLPIKYKDYYLGIANEFKNKKVKVDAITRRYSFNGKKGTNLILKSLELINID